MKLCITLEITSVKGEMDIQVNSEQKLFETMEILLEAGLMPGSLVTNMTHVYSRRQKSRINMRMTYDQAGILNGDRLCLEENGEEHNDEKHNS